MSKDKYGICLLSLIPCREEPNDRSQMVTQLLFGELVEIVSQNEKWFKIKNLSDKYTSWVDKKQINLIPKNLFDKLLNSEFKRSEDILSPVQISEDEGFSLIPCGSHVYDESLMVNMNSHFKDFDKELKLRTKADKVNREQIVEDALSFLNAPYLWGGKSILGIDCSGFSQLIYELNGIQIPRDAYQQAELGQSLSFIEEAEFGDLAFFDNNEGKIIHVGIMLNENRIIHASGKVRIDRIDHQGIFNNELNDYSHSLRIIKKII